MFDATLKKVHEQLKRYSFFRKIFDVLEKTPRHAVHWYILMALGLLVTIVNVGLAWAVFRSTSTQASDALTQAVNSATIRREALQEALETYQARKVELGRLRQNTPRIIDPGR